MAQKITAGMMRDTIAIYRPSTPYGQSAPTDGTATYAVIHTTPAHVAPHNGYAIQHDAAESLGAQRQHYTLTMHLVDTVRADDLIRWRGVALRVVTVSSDPVAARTRIVAAVDRAAADNLPQEG